MPVTRVTENELASYQRRAEYFATQWQRLDPLVLALKRPADDSSPSQVLEFEARLQPFGEEKYGWLFSLLGPPMQEVIRVTDHEVLTVQASVKGGLLLPGTAPHHLFVTLDDDRPPPLEKPSDLWGLLDMIRTAPRLSGAWPKPGFLDVLPFGLALNPIRPDSRVRSWVCGDGRATGYRWWHSTASGWSELRNNCVSSPTRSRHTCTCRSVIWERASFAPGSIRSPIGGLARRRSATCGC